MDPLFERRELVRNVHLDARHLQRNIHASLVAQLRMKYEGKCTAEGYIQRQSITVVEHSLGRTNLIKGGVDYTVRFQADLCLPHPGQVFRTPVVLKSKIGIHAEMTPIDVLLPRDLHIANQEFDAINEGEEVEFEVVGSRFQQGDETIVVLGKLRSIIQPATNPETLEASEALGQFIAAPVGTPGASGEPEKKTVTVDVAAAKAPEAVRRKRIQTKVAVATNEPKPQGTPA
jgi:DNA-directed RNA polymerase subunit E'/Rpb7